MRACDEIAPDSPFQTIAVMNYFAALRDPVNEERYLELSLQRAPKLSSLFFRKYRFLRGDPSRSAEALAALETAENVMADGDALQEEINDVMLQLVKGMADLRLRPDKSLLEELLKEANGKNKESYTEESYQNLLSAISVADAAYSNLEADQEEVDGAAELLRAAIDSLEPAGSPDPENPDPETPGTGTSDPEPESPVSDPEDSNTGKPEGNSSDAGTQSSSLDGKKTASASGNASDAGNGNAQSAAKAVRTGDNAHPAIYAAVLLALAAGAGYTVCGRRKKK